MGRVFRGVAMVMDDTIATVALIIGMLATFLFAACGDLSLMVLSIREGWVQVCLGILAFTLGPAAGVWFYRWASRGFPGKNRVGSASTLRERHHERRLMEAARFAPPVDEEARAEQARLFARERFLAEAEAIAHRHYGLNTLTANLAAHEALGAIERMAKQ